MAQDVARDQLILALRAGDVKVSEFVEPDGRIKTHFQKNGIPESQYLPEIVPHRLAMRLLCKFDVPRDWAWHIDRIPPGLLPTPPAAH